MIGRTFGRYHILEQLGSGGMAEVYRARDLRLERDVAFKIIRLDRMQDPDFVRRFQREARALGQLVHPHIVRVVDYGDEDGVPYLVMDYLPGGTLKHRLGRMYTPPDAARLLAPIARALAYAHSRGIVHRDVKPANILLTASDHPMLTDFGIAKIVQDTATTTSLTAEGMGVGTPEYTAPEQWTGGAEPRSDEYALGVVFYELVTGRRPYTADTPAGVLLKQATEPLPRPRALVPSLPDSDEQVLLKALARDAADRYPTLDAFAEELERISLRPAVIEGRQGPTLLHAPPVRPRRWPRLALAGAGVLLLGALTFGLWSWQISQQETAAATATGSAAQTEAAAGAAETARVATARVAAAQATRAVAAETATGVAQATAARDAQLAAAGTGQAATADAQSAETTTAVAGATAERAASATAAADATRAVLSQIQPPCGEALSVARIWQGALEQSCAVEPRGAGTLALELSAADWSIVEVYSALLPVEPNRTYEVSYWLRTEIEINGAELYGRVLAAQFSAQAQEGQAITENRLDNGFGTGRSVGGSSAWSVQSYTFTTLPDAAFVRLRGVLGGPTGTARGRMWLAQVRLSPR